MLAKSLSNISLLYPETKEGSIVQIDSLISIVLSPEIRWYDTLRWGEDPLENLDGDNSYISYLSHLAWMIGNYKKVGGDDKYNNLIIVHTGMERLIKSQDKKEINRILNKYKLECNQRRKVNTIRKNAGLEEIDVKALDKEL